MTNRFSAQAEPRDRAMAIGAAVLLQGALGYALISGFAVTFVRQLQHDLGVVAFVAPPAAPPPMPLLEQPHKASGKAAPPAKDAKATPVVAPVTTVRPQPIAAAPKPGIGTSLAQGASPRDGPGSGAGGEGAGTGSGGFGNGEGDGGTDAEQIAGDIREHDYPHDAFVARRTGRVGLRFTVGVTGRVTDCTVTHSSGTPELDNVTCALIIKRFRYRPARDALGRAVPQQVTGDHEWVIPKLPPPEKGEEDEG
ncbi:energy transducer TonB [Sphingomonas sp. GlSt437]|uniref:energy transducer TonB n=1 Tax=Sphingomonas sp. GlSt437 TaxID=3389970 RepID=UPI003A8632C4